ncbi:MAG: stage II sporulation protein M [archaeon]|nr:stage II sporulation protein M [archaeon]MCR4323441.1 stage II sporulation protein M [Nanoarchaeota archaeon]
MKKKTNSLSKNYSLCWKFLKETKKYILFAIILFAFFFIVGFLFPIFFREQIINLLIELADIFFGKTLIEGIIAIFFNNLQASFFAIIFGIGFGIIPLIIAVTNGYLLGFVSREASNIEGPLILWRILPHGIFELPAVMFSIGIGLRLGVSLFSKERKTKKEFKEAIRFFIFVIIPLLLIASIIEGCLIFLMK